MTPEFSRLVRVDSIGPEGMVVELAATAEECAAVAIRLGVPAVASLACRFRLEPAAGGRVAAHGRLTVKLTRECVVSLDPFETSHAERFRLRFVPAGTESDDVDPESDDEIPYAEGAIDLGEAAVEQLALDLDPYPRSPGAELPTADDAAPTGPFAALAALRRMASKD